MKSRQKPTPFSDGNPQPGTTYFGLLMFIQQRDGTWHVIKPGQKFGREVIGWAEYNCRTMMLLLQHKEFVEWDGLGWHRYNEPVKFILASGDQNAIALSPEDRRYLVAPNSDPLGLGDLLNEEEVALLGKLF